MSEEARLAAIVEVRLNRIDEKLSEFNRKVANSMRKSQKDMDVANDNWAKLFSKKPNLAKALDGVIDNTRLKVLDSGVARVGLLGSALEDLGVAGLGAAAAIALFAGSAVQAREAAKFGDEIGDTAKNLHVTTDALQEYRYASRAAGGDTAGADAALEAFGITLGKAQENLPKAVKGFTALGFSKTQIDSFKTVEDALVAVTDRIEKLGANHQKDAIIDQLGLTGLKPLIEDGVDSMERLKAEAKSLGLVMDAGIVARAGDANDQFEKLEDIINVQLKTAFVDLAPVLLNLLKVAADLSREFADVAASFQDIGNRSDTALKDKKAQLEASIAGSQSSASLPGGKEYIARLQGKLDKINAELATRAKAEQPDIPHGTTLIDPNAAAAAAAARQKARELALVRLRQDRQTEDAVSSAKERELAAYTSLGSSLEDYLALQDELTDLQRRSRDRRLDDEAEEYKISAGTRGLSAAQVRSIKAANAQADAAEDATRATEKASALANQALSVSQDHASSTGATTQLRMGLARSARERRALEAAQLAIDQQQARDQLENDIRFDPKYRNADGADDRARADLAAQQKAEKDQAARSNLGPMADWIDKLPTSIDEINEAFETLGVQGISSLNSGLASAIANSESLGATVSNVFKQLEIQAIQLALEIAEKKFASALGLPGFETGGYTGHGPANGVAGVVHRGEVVFDQPAVSRLGVPFLEGLRKGKIPGFRNGGFVGNLPSIQSVAGPRSTVVQQFFPSFEGAVVTEELMADFKAYADRTGATATVHGARGGAALAAAEARQAATGKLGL